MADGEDVGECASREAIMEAAFTSGSPPKKSGLPKILPFVSGLQQDDVLAKGKELEGNVSSRWILEEIIPSLAELRQGTVDLICRHLTYLAAVNGSFRGWQYQPKDMEYALKVEKFMKEAGGVESRLGEILFQKMDYPFLRQLLEDTLDSQESSRNAKKGGISPDPVLAALAAAPSLYRRGNADELFAPIPWQWEEE